MLIYDKMFMSRQSLEKELFMKKIISLIIIVLTATFLGCSFISPTTNSTTLENTTNIETTLITTSIEQRIQAEFAYLESYIPNEITENFSLPIVFDSDIRVRFFQDNLLMESNIFTYTPGLVETSSRLSIELSIYDVTELKEYTIHLVENATLYNQMIIDQAFNEIDSILNDLIPEFLDGDFLIPEVVYEKAFIVFSTDTLEIFNGFYVFPFPMENELVTLVVTIRFQGITKINEYDIILKSLNSLLQIPEIHINTSYNEAITSKEEYVEASFSLITFDQNQNQIPLVANENMKIRLRGNSTFHMPKKSYKIKFENKTSLLFDHSEKIWVLLANFADQTLIRNTLANNLSSRLDLDFTPSSAFVDVYLDAIYLGNYFLTDQIEVSSDRVDIEEHSYDTDTGFLLEMDKRLSEPDHEGIEGIDFFFSYGIPYDIKSPKTDSKYYSSEQYNYIKNYISQVHYTLQTKQDYSSLIDESSFVDWFIVQEVFQNVDSGYSSVYMHKDKSGLLKMGPVWDFDLSTGNPGHLGDDLRKPEGWYTSLEYKNIWYFYLMKYDGFKQNLKTRWNEVYLNQIQGMINDIYSTSNSISKSRYLNFIKWDVIGTWEDWYTAPEILAATTYQEQVKFLYDFLVIRTDWLNNEINKW